MTITYVIPGATLIDQLNEATMDGHIDEDANDNCVAASVAEGLHIETSKTFVGDEVKDAVYGQGYVGTQSAARYVGYCANEGVDLTPHNGSQADLIATIHAQVSAGHPVILTMPSNWGTPYSDPVHPSGSTHVGIAVGVGPGEIRVMNPWHGFWQDATDAWWQARLCYGQVWVMQKQAAQAAGVSNMSGVPAGWSDDGTTLLGAAAPDGKRYTVQHGIRAEILAEGNHDPADVPITEELQVAQVEIGNPSLGSGAIQFFLMSGQRSYTEARGTFRTWNGQEMLALRNDLATAQAATSAAQQQLAAAQSNLAAAQSQRDALSAQLAVAKSDLAAANATIAQLQQQLATAQQAAQQAAQQPAPSPAPAPAVTPAPTTPAAAAALLVSLIYAEADATLKAASSAPTTSAPQTAG